MNEEALRRAWREEESAAHMLGWDFSHIRERYTEEDDLPWDYTSLACGLLRRDVSVLDYDTGGGEFLLSLGHPPSRTAATEGYPPNVALCRRTLLPLGIDFRECADPVAIPFADASFDLILNRHGDLCAPEFYRLLRSGGTFLTEQVGAENDRDLVEMVLPGTQKPYPQLTLRAQRAAFEAAGFHVLRAEEAFRPIVFFDVAAFVWFAKIIEWEFPGFSVDGCFERLLEMHRRIQRDGRLQGTIHRLLIVAEK